MYIFLISSLIVFIMADGSSISSPPSKPGPMQDHLIPGDFRQTLNSLRRQPLNLTGANKEECRGPMGWHTAELIREERWSIVDRSLPTPNGLREWMTVGVGSQSFYVTTNQFTQRNTSAIFDDSRMPIAFCNEVHTTSLVSENPRKLRIDVAETCSGDVNEPPLRQRTRSIEITDNGNNSFVADIEPMQDLNQSPKLRCRLETIMSSQSSEEPGRPSTGGTQTVVD
jgi:hypothetical protein